MTNELFSSDKELFGESHVAVLIHTMNGQVTPAFVSLPTFIQNQDISSENIMNPDGLLNYLACTLVNDMEEFTEITPILYQHVFGFLEEEQ